MIGVVGEVHGIATDSRPTATMSRARGPGCASSTPSMHHARDKPGVGRQWLPSTARCRICGGAVAAAARSAPKAAGGIEAAEHAPRCRAWTVERHAVQETSAVIGNLCTISRRVCGLQPTPRRPLVRGLPLEIKEMSTFTRLVLVVVLRYCRGRRRALRSSLTRRGAPGLARPPWSRAACWKRAGSQT